ncbi:MAG: cysteine synthase family protein [Nitrososphaerota archaeon]|nr:cysteine synthase family protein [Nitrososphaerota archaeon]
MLRVVDSILELIGNTPMLRLNRLMKAEGIQANILLKLEYLNPSGSYKDRFIRMVESAEREGKLKPGYTIVESSSGNTAIALAMIGAVKGYKVKIFYPQDVWQMEKKKILERFGAEIEMVPLEETDLARKYGVHGARVEIPGRIKCKELEESRSDVWWARQFSNPENVAAHRELGKEILKQTDGKVDVFIASIGTGGNFLGVSQVLKSEIPNVKCIAVEPSQRPGRIDPLSKEAKYIPGVTGGIIEEIRKSGLVDEIVYVSNEDARDTAYKLSRIEGVFCGMSTGANVYVALKEARRLKAGQNIVTCAVDRGDRYLTDERFIT